MKTQLMQERPEGREMGTQTMQKSRQQSPSIEVKRNEIKYYVNYNDFLAVSNALDHALERDSYDNGRGYFIRSLYFDTLENKAFEEKMMGIERRKKYRLRLYDFNSKEVKFEVKNKFNENILKETVWIKRQDAEELQKGNYDVLLHYNSPTLRKAYAEFKKFCYRPVVVIDYERSAFVYDFNNTRITFDRNIKASSIDLNMFNKSIFMKPLLNSKLVVLEVKFDRFIPDWLKSIIQMRGCRSAIGKYCIGRLDNKICWI